MAASVDLFKFFCIANGYGWSNVAKFNKIIILIQRIIYILKEIIILI